MSILLRLSANPDSCIAGTDEKDFPGRRGVEQAAGAKAVDLSGFRGAALNQSLSASGVYTGLVC